MLSNLIVNRVIVSSIPINRKVKGYWVKKYQRMVASNGIDYAQKKFKALKIALMDYKANPDRMDEVDSYYAISGFRVNGYLKSLFQMMDTQPHFVLNFVKLYSSETTTTQTPDGAAAQTNQRLKAIDSDVDVPLVLDRWLEIVKMSWRERIEYYYFAKANNRMIFSHYAKHHTLEEWKVYWSKQIRILRSGLNKKVDAEARLVFPEVYKDYTSSPNGEGSVSFLQDFADLVSLHMEDEFPLSAASLSFIADFLSEDLQDELATILFGGESSFEGLYSETSILSGKYVGHIHHIKKKGAGNELRDIAVPNRFIQQALVPIAARLYSVLRMMPRDASFNQNRFDRVLTNRVTNDCLYQGSVDLSKATDNLPFNWGKAIVNTLFDLIEPSSHEKLSWDLFNEIVDLNWEDCGYLTKWNHGQPLGSLPSFAVLGLTHNLLVESIALDLGCSHSPYYILGDDIVITNRKVRMKYISLMNRHRVPLSLHKSFTGELTEFAGKIFIKKNVPFYTPDHAPITWNSLFDYQVSSGIKVPWNNLPLDIKRKIEKVIQPFLPTPSSKQDVSRQASLAYKAAQACLVLPKGSSQNHIDFEGNAEIFFEYLYSKDDILPEGTAHTGIVMCKGFPVIFHNSKFNNKHGYVQRFREIELPQWYKDKARPCATDKAILGGISAILGYLVK